MEAWRSVASTGLAGLALAALAVPAVATPAPGTWTRCRLEDGVLVVPARAAGLTGQFVLDTGADQSQLDATQASLAGLTGATAVVPVRVGGLRFRRLTVGVIELDARTHALPTPITGVLGADVIGRRALEVWPDPCRFRLGATSAPRARPLASLRLEPRGRVPYVSAGVSDGARALRGLFRVSTGGVPAVRLDPKIARLEGAAANTPDVTAPLRALSIGPLLIEQAPASIADSGEAGVAGEIGEPVWARYGFRLDLRRGRLLLFAPNRRTRRRGSGGS